jgi:hypothetical protein
MEINEVLQQKGEHSEQSSVSVAYYSPRKAYHYSFPYGRAFGILLSSDNYCLVGPRSRRNYRRDDEYWLLRQYASDSHKLLEQMLTFWLL